MTSHTIDINTVADLGTGAKGPRPPPLQDLPPLLRPFYRTNSHESAHRVKNPPFWSFGSPHLKSWIRHCNIVMTQPSNTPAFTQPRQSPIFSVFDQLDGLKGRAILSGFAEDPGSLAHDNKFHSLFAYI